MIYTVIGGDTRMDRLHALLRARGYTAYRLIGDEAASDVKRALSSADAVILPLPVSRDGRTLSSPASTFEIPLDAIVSLIPYGCRVLGGMIDAKLREALECRGADVYDYGFDEEVLVRGARATAEAALAIIIENTDVTCFGMKVAVLGYGRVAKEMARALAALGADVTVYARREVARAGARAMGYGARDTVAGVLPCDVIVNTVPAPLDIGDAPMDAALTLDLASMRCFDEKLCKKYMFAPGLPGKYSPHSAAEYLFDCVIRVTGGESV